MAKEILLYTSINDYSAAQFITDLEANKGVDIVCRMNTPGGAVYSAYGMIAKWAEHAKGKTIKVDGRADSGGFFMCCYADNVECLDVSTFLAHRAAMPSWIESNTDYFTDEVKAELTRINKQLRASMEGKFTSEKFFKVTGVSLDALFSLEDRIDVVLDSTQAKALGLVSKVTSITPEKAIEINTMTLQIAANNNTIPVPQPIVIPQSKDKIMNAAEFKAAHPAAYAEIVAEGAKSEKSRVKAWMAFSAVDPKASAAGIAGDEAVTMDVIAEMSMKAASGKRIADVIADSPVAVSTTEAPAKELTEEEKKIKANTESFLATCKADMGLK